MPVSSLTATDNVGVTGYLINKSATAPAASAAGWTATAPTSVTAVAGSNTFYAWAKDAAGNVSARQKRQCNCYTPALTPPPGRQRLHPPGHRHQPDRTGQQLHRH